VALRLVSDEVYSQLKAMDRVTPDARVLAEVAKSLAAAQLSVKRIGEASGALRLLAELEKQMAAESERLMSILRVEFLNDLAPTIRFYEQTKRDLNVLPAVPIRQSERISIGRALPVAAVRPIVAELRNQLTEKDEMIATQGAQIAAKDARIAYLEQRLREESMEWWPYEDFPPETPWEDREN
jgi:hypothetical protein